METRDLLIANDLGREEPSLQKVSEQRYGFARGHYDHEGHGRERKEVVHHRAQADPLEQGRQQRGRSRRKRDSCGQLREARRLKKLIGGDEGADLLAVYSIAERLGKFAHEVLAMPADEMNGWLVYINHQNRLRKHHGS